MCLFQQKISTEKHWLEGGGEANSNFHEFRSRNENRKEFKEKFTDKEMNDEGAEAKSNFRKITI